MKRKAAPWHTKVDWTKPCAEAHEAGAHEFGHLWLRANEDAVAMFREAGFSAELESSDKRLASAISRTIYRTLDRSRNLYNANKKQEAT